MWISLINATWNQMWQRVFYQELVRSSLRLVSTSSSSENEDGFLFSLRSGAILLFRRRPRATSAMSESGSELRICWCARWRSRQRPMWMSSDLDPNSRWQIEHSRKCGGRDCRALPIIELAFIFTLLTFLEKKFWIIITKEWRFEKMWRFGAVVHNL